MIRFWDKVEKTVDHWLWVGARNSNGRGCFGINQRTILATHMAWYLSSGNWPKSQLNHLCDQPLCVNPGHLYEGTAKENSRDRSLTDLDLEDIENLVKEEYFPERHKRKDLSPEGNEPAMSTTENPYRVARLSHNLSQAKLADLSGVSRLSVLRLEQGLFSEPLGKVSIALGLNHKDASRDYWRFQSYRRRTAKSSPPSPVESFIDWRQRCFPSQASFCIALCVSQASIHRYETMPSAMMPGQLREALLEAGLTSKQINQLAKRAHSAIA